jgi:phosphate transport system substrate-binding protein
LFVLRLSVVVALAVSLVVVPGLAFADTALTESGSTLLYPVMSAWAAAYAKIVPTVQVTTAATGSGAGVQAAQEGTTDLGASDVAIGVDAQHEDLAQIPLAISGQFIAFELPGINALKLSPEVLAAIYAGRITQWNDRRIAALNPGVALPGATIVPLRRSDRSGDTYLFTAYLSEGAPHDWTLAPATSIAWPSVAGEQSEKGNRELLDLLTHTRNGIAYIGISLDEQAQTAGLGIAELRNRAGAFVAPTPDAVEAAAQRMGHIPPDGRVSLIDLPGATTYPIVNVEYAVVKKHQPRGEIAAALRGFLGWIVDPAGGNAPAMLDPVHFAPLPDALRGVSRATIAALR